MDTLNWDLTTGCESLGGGCDSCPSLWEYRENGWDYQIKQHYDRLADPVFIRPPTLFTVSLGSDLFHEDVNSDFIHYAFKVMNREIRHTFEITTKRSERLAMMSEYLHFTKNIAVGVTVEESKYKFRIDHLRDVPATTRYVSFLPLLGEMGKLDLDGIRTVTVGSEDWGLHRACDGLWIEDIKKQCSEQGVEVMTDFHIYTYDKEV